MKTPNKFLLITVFALVFCLGVSQVYAGDPSRIGTAGGSQLLVPVGARDIAMAGANLAYTSGLDAIHWNPAGLANMQSSAAGLFSTMQMFNDINVNYAAIGVKAGRLGVLAFSIKAIDAGEIPITTNTDPDGLSGQTYSPTMMTVGVTYSKRLTEAIGFGVTGKVLSESIPRASASAFAIDAGIQYHNLGGLRGVSFGIAVKNIGTNLEYSGSGLLVNGSSVGSSLSGNPLGEFVERPAASNQLPGNVELSLGYQRSINEDNQLILSGTFDSQNFGNDMFKFGGEYMYTDLISLRAGYSLQDRTASDDELHQFALGVGLHYQFGATNITLDYAFRDSEYFDGNNLFSIKLAF